MEAKSNALPLYDYHQSDRMFEEKDLLRKLEEEAELCIQEHTEDEVTAAIGMMLMHYQAVSDAQFTPKNKPIVQGSTSKPPSIREENCPQTVAKEDTILHNIQHTTDMKRKNRKSAANKSSSLLASCRNILKEFLSQNSM